MNYHPDDYTAYIISNKRIVNKDPSASVFIGFNGEKFLMCLYYVPTHEERAYLPKSLVGVFNEMDI